MHCAKHQTLLTHTNTHTRTHTHTHTHTHSLRWASAYQIETAAMLVGAEKMFSWSTARLCNNIETCTWTCLHLCPGGGSPSWTNANVPICTCFTSERSLPALHACCAWNNAAAWPTTAAGNKPTANNRKLLHRITHCISCMHADESCLNMPEYNIIRRC